VTIYLVEFPARAAESNEKIELLGSGDSDGPYRYRAKKIKI
jgi:hypothetical protein